MRTCSPSRSPYGRIQSGNRDQTSSIAINPIQPIPLINHNLRVNFVNPAPSRYTWIHLQRANGIQEVDGSIPFGSTRTTYQSSKSYNRSSRRPGHRPVRFVWNCLGSATTSRQPKVMSPKPGHTGYRWHPAQTDGTFAGQFGRTLFRNCLPEMEEGGSEVFNRTGSSRSGRPTN